MNNTGSKLSFVLGLFIGFMNGCAPANQVVVDAKPTHTDIEYNASNFEPANSAVKIILRNGGACSGVVVSEHIILTAAHCTYLRPKSIVELPNSRIISWQPHPHKDLAIITVDSVGSIPFAKIAQYEPERGANLYLVGYGCKGTREVRKLSYEYPVINDWDERDADLVPADENPLASYQPNLRSNGCSCAGDSGGAVYDENGLIVGIHVSTLIVELNETTCNTISHEVSIENFFINFNALDDALGNLQ